ncbi:MAG: hypothetical protein R2706_01530 [Acidimicrobiales bacterium]
MTRLCEDRVCIVTGGGRGIGREHALLVAEHGANVIVNDLGGSMDGQGNDVSAAEEVAAEIRAGVARPKRMVMTYRTGRGPSASSTRR